MLTNYRAFEREAVTFRQQRADAKRLEKDLKKSIRDEMSTERAKVEEALKAYNEKLETVVKKRKGEIDKIETYHQQMSNTLHKTFAAFEETVKAIQADRSIPSEEEKMRKIDEIADKITRSLFTKEEAEQFKKLASSMVIVIPSDAMQRSRVHRPRISNGATGRSRITYF